MSTLALPLHLVRPQVERKPVNKWLVTVSVSFGTLMGAIDASIVNVALTHIRGSVGASLQEITWISTGFVVATVLVMPLTAFLGRLVGQKRLYMISLVDRKSTRLNSSHVSISYAVFCLKKKNNK